MDKDVKILFTLLIITILISGGLCIYIYFNTEYTSVEGKVIDTEFDSDINVLTVTFDNGKNFDIYLAQQEYDFTVNSKLILKLFKQPPEKYWRIDKIVKVPDLEESK